MVLPVSRPPVEDGAVVVRGDRIDSVGRWRHLRRAHAGAVCDLGEVVLLPGLINAHCHLDYTHMAGLFPPPTKFTDWIKLITTEKGLWSNADFEASWIAGARMLLHRGTTTVADIEAIPQILPRVWAATPLRVLSCLEMTGVRSRRKPELILRETLATIGQLSTDERHAAGLSPHAPYSTTARLLQKSAVAARKHRLRVVTHVAESGTEFEMFAHARGEMFDWLARNERDMRDCGGVSPVQHLARHRALSPRLLAVHVNYLVEGDALLLARHHVSVVHCPRSHEYFGHREFPRRVLAKAGVNLCLGTDSLATVRKHPKRELELNLFLEMRAFARTHPGVHPRQIVQMATVNGARALGLRGKRGELKRNAAADLIAVPVTGKPGDSYAAVVNHTGELTASMIAGEWIIPPQ